MENENPLFCKSDMIKDYEEGGLKTIDFDIMSGVIKLKWLQSFLINESSFWNLHVQRMWWYSFSVTM